MSSNGHFSESLPSLPNCSLLIPSKPTLHNSSPVLHLHTPSHLNSDRLRQVFLYAGTDNRAAAAEVAAVNLLAAAIESSRYPVAPFRVDFARSFLHAETPRKVLYSRSTS